MKKCSNCGTMIDDGYNYCPNCGMSCDNSSDRENESNNSTDDITDKKEGQYPLKWHRFMMVMMIISAVFTIINGFGVISGIEYVKEGLQPPWSCSPCACAFPALKSCDVFYGIVIICLGIYQFVVRNSLNQFRKNGPSLLKSLYLLSIIAGIIYMSSVSSITGTNLFSSTNMGSVGSSVLFLILNSIYYSKRSELFVN